MDFSTFSLQASAHPLAASASDADPQARAADAALAGPDGCWESAATLAWDHRSGGFVAQGGAESAWRLDHRTWRLDRYVPTDPDGADVRIAPQLLGRAVTAGLRYPTTPRRYVDWPPPVSTLPVRLFGQVETLSVDRLEDGTTRVTQSFAWDGWKDVAGARSVTFDPAGVATGVTVDATDRWRNGCTVRSIGTAALDPRGLPTIETWTFEGRCSLRSWTARWLLEYGDWSACEP